MKLYNNCNPKHTKVWYDCQIQTVEWEFKSHLKHMDAPSTEMLDSNT